MSRPFSIDTSGWAPFNPVDPADAACERERQAFTQYTLKRFQKSPKTGSDEQSIWVGGLMSIVQVIHAMHGNAPPEQAREAMHKALDYCWLQCSSMSVEPEDLN